MRLSALWEEIMEFTAELYRPICDHAAKRTRFHAWLIFWLGLHFLAAEFRIDRAIAGPAGEIFPTIYMDFEY